MIKKAKSLLFPSRKNKDDQKKDTKVNDDAIEQFSGSDNEQNDQLSPVKHNEPPLEELESLINLYSEGKFTKALSLINELLDQFPYSVDLYNVAGASNAGLKNFDASIRNYRQAIKINSDFADAYNNIGNAFLGKGDLDEDTRVVICYGLKNNRMLPFYGFTVLKSPQLLQLTESDMAEITEVPLHPGELMKVTLQDAEVIIPKVEYFEDPVLKLIH